MRDSCTKVLVIGTSENYQYDFLEKIFLKKYPPPQGGPNIVPVGRNVSSTRMSMTYYVKHFTYKFGKATLYKRCHNIVIPIDGSEFIDHSFIEDIIADSKNFNVKKVLILIENPSNELFDNLKKKYENDNISIIKSNSDSIRDSYFDFIEQLEIDEVRTN